MNLVPITLRYAAPKLLSERILTLPVDAVRGSRRYLWLSYGLWCMAEWSVRQLFLNRESIAAAEPT